MFKVSQKVCLWQLAHGLRGILVMKEVVVTLTEVKTGALGALSREPVSMQSLRGVGDDGKHYEKHWESWPESQTGTFSDQWSWREDELEGDPMMEVGWIPFEAVHIYNYAKLYNITLIDKDGNAITPKGDVVYCAEHDRYWHEGVECRFCRRAKREAEKAVTKPSENESAERIRNACEHGE